MEKNFDDCLELIKSEKIREFVKKALAAAPKEFFLAPGSSRGHHAPEEQGKGGLVLHTRKGIRVILSLFRFFEIENQLAKDKILAGFILHDTQKGGIPWGRFTHPEHGLISARILMGIAAEEPYPSRYKEDFVHIDKDLMDIIALVRDHMGIWSQPLPTPALKIGEPITEKSVWLLIVQLADYLSSRKWFSFVY